MKNRKTQLFLLLAAYVGYFLGWFVVIPRAKEYTAETFRFGTYMFITIVFSLSLLLLLFFRTVSVTRAEHGRNLAIQEGSLLAVSAVIFILVILRRPAMMTGALYIMAEQICTFFCSFWKHE